VPAKLISPLAAVLAAAVLLGGCGSDDGSATADKSDAKGYTVKAVTTVSVAKPPLSTARFTARVNGICRRAWRVILANWRYYTIPTQATAKLSASRRFAEAVRLSLLAGIVFHIFDEIQELGAPRGQVAAVERLIGSLQRSAELGELGKWKAHSVSEIPPNFAAYNARARRYGLEECLVDGARLAPIEFKGRS
jgi:hypothetical protein